MTQVFLTVLDMSKTASLVILAVLLARLPLKKAPRAVSCVLWLAVLFRLLCPWSPESRYVGMTAQLPAITWEAAAAKPQEIPVPANYSTDSDAEIPAETITQEAASTSPASWRPSWQQIGACLWVTGMAALAVHSLVSLLRLKKRLVGAMRLRDNIYLADHLETAFVLGLVRPKIYLPSSLPEQEQTYILAHEQTHIRRGDPWWKALAFLALAVHWFNPLVWLAFVQSGKDMETACDEAVLRRLGPEIEPDYAASLLRLTTERRILSSAPLAFGEGDTGGRIRHILRYKKPAFWVILASVLAVLILGAVLVLNRAETVDYWNARYTVADILYEAPQYDFAYTTSTAPEYAILPDGSLYACDTDGRELIYSGEWAYAGTLVPVELDRQARSALFQPSDSNVQKIMDDVTAVYEVQWPVSGSEQTTFHYLMVTRQANLYLTVGHSQDRVRWLFQLDCQSGSGEMEYLDLLIENQLQMDITSFSLFESDDIPGAQLVGWTSGTEIGFSELLYEKTGGKRSYTAVGISGWASGSSTEIYPLSYTPQNGGEARLIVLSRNEGLNEIVYSSDGKTCRESVTGYPYMTVLPGTAAEIQYLDRLGNALSVESASGDIQVSDGLRVRSASWAASIWPGLYPDGQTPSGDQLASITIPANQQMLVLELEDLPDTDTLNITLAQDSMVLKRDRDGLFYLFLPEQAETPLLCRVLFEDCYYIFQVVLESPSISYDSGDSTVDMSGGNALDPYAGLAYDLSENGPRVLASSELTGFRHLFRTNSTEIRIQLTTPCDTDLLVEVLTPEGGEDAILQGTLQPGQTLTFRNLTSRSLYALRITGRTDPEVEVSD